VTNKIVYSWNVVIREVKTIPKSEVQQREEEPKTMEFDLECEESESIE
jgi:hypothetical protein